MDEQPKCKKSVHVASWLNKVNLLVKWHVNLNFALSSTTEDVRWPHTTNVSHIRTKNSLSPERVPPKQNSGIIRGFQVMILRKLCGPHLVHSLINTPADWLNRGSGLVVLNGVCIRCCRILLFAFFSYWFLSLQRNLSSTNENLPPLWITGAGTTWG